MAHLKKVDHITYACERGAIERWAWFHIEVEGGTLINRIDDVRFNYLRLYALDQQQAAKLLQAMRAWLETNKGKPPTGIDMPALAEWMESQAASLKVVPGEKVW